MIKLTLLLVTVFSLGSCTYPGIPSSFEEKETDSVPKETVLPPVLETNPPLTPEATVISVPATQEAVINPTSPVVSPIDVGISGTGVSPQWE